MLYIYARTYLLSIVAITGNLGWLASHYRIDKELTPVNTYTGVGNLARKVTHVKLHAAVISQ